MTTMKPCPKCHSTEHLHIGITDLYGRPNGCAHADRQRDWMRYRVWMGLEQCPSWWLDQNRFERA